LCCAPLSKAVAVLRSAEKTLDELQFTVNIQPLPLCLIK
jgi:hypothetical protein